MRRAQWHRPEETCDAPVSPGAHPVLAALAQELGHGSGGRDGQFSIERQRLVGRSSVYVVRGRIRERGDGRWVVKRPNPEWPQAHFDSPLTAWEEFSALQRLEKHFEDVDAPCRVPDPIAFLPGLDAFVMEYVSGPTLSSLMTYRSSLRPGRLLGGIAAAGTFIRHLHALEPPAPMEVDLRNEAELVLAIAEETLRPVGLSLPEPVRRTLAEVPSVRVQAPRVLLHGDFIPSNVLIDAHGRAVGVDASLTTGHAEDDLARFVAVAVSRPYLAAEIAVPPVAVIRREFARRLFDAYYGSPTPPPLLEIRYLRHLCQRWLRLRDLGEQRERRILAPARTRTRMRLIEGQVGMLMKDSGRRLVSGLG